MADITVPFNATFGLAAGVESTAIILEDATIKPNVQQSYTALQTFAGGISAAGGITFNGTLVGVTATFNRLLTANAGISAAGATLSGTVTAPTPALGNNSTLVATTAFVQNEIVADTVTTFNGRTGAVQGVSAAVAGTGISVSGATGAVTITNIGVQSFNGLTGAVTGVTVGGANTFTALNTFNAGISASALTVAGGATFSSNVYLGDAATGVTASSNDYVNILAGGYYKSGIYRSYKTLAASTSAIVCTTPSDNAANTVNTFEVTLEYYETGYVPRVAVHKFWIVVAYDNTGAIGAFDYTESIVKASSTTLVPFTISTHSSGYSLNITAAAPANTGKYSGWAFLTTVRVY